ncbi:MAG: sigma-54-dependent Fis family transcriptional regulator [Planctomycetota bacterium]|nr:MAG: sigma-54-dependent Fis family transcriptional regulator [Planctomycetota bacterium]
MSWTAHVGTILHLLDPTSNPRHCLDRLWAEVEAWESIDGIWVSCLPGHLQPSGTVLAGRCPDNADEIASLASPSTASVNTDGLPVVARQLRDGNVPVAIILVSHHHQPQPAGFLVDALSRYLLDRLRLQLEASELAEENHYLRSSLTPQVMQHDIITVSGLLETVIRSAVRTAPSNATVLINGETGTGKELLARLVHTHSTRAHKPLVTVNAGALATPLLESELFGHVRGAFTGADHDRKGLFEVADGGTVFLDEVGELSPEGQVRLLRVLQERTVTRVGDHRPIPVDVRVIAATHRELSREVAQGRFRQDLYFRLNVVSLNLPPLRDRPEDIPLLINHFLQKFNRENYKQVDHVPRKVLEILQAYPWPGNVRELENCVQKVVVLAAGSSFSEDLIPPTIRSYVQHPGIAGSSGDGAMLQVSADRLIPDDHMENLMQAIEHYAASAGPNISRAFNEIERLLITHALAAERGVKLRAAKRLGINRVTLDRKLVEYQLTVRRGIGVLERPEDPPLS